MENYSTNVKLNDNSRMQFMYASQNYETFYCIFGKFHIIENKISKIDFELINYKGKVNLGFLGSSSIDSEIFIKRENKNLLIGFPVKASTGNNKSEIKSHNFWDNKEISIVGITRIYVFRGLICMNSDNEQFHQLFDSEFYYRDGIEEPIKISSNRLGYFDDLFKWNTYLSNLELEIPKSDNSKIYTSNLLMSQKMDKESPSTNCRVGIIETI